MEIDKILDLPVAGRGTARVCGLAVSRSIGARHAQPYVVPDPDVSEVQVSIDRVIWFYCV